MSPEATYYVRLAQARNDRSLYLGCALALLVIIATEPFFGEPSLFWSCVNMLALGLFGARGYRSHQRVQQLDMQGPPQ
jgi:hypothetical protein